MDIRASTNPLIVRVRGCLDQFNARHPWSHNDHFHRWILRNLPQHRGRALDVGCGRGELLAALANRFEHAEGTDRDQTMRDAAAQRTTGLGNVAVTAHQLDELDGPYDLITMVAVLHHLDLDHTLAQIRRLLAPGGRFLVVGLAPPVSTADQIWDLASAVANPLIGIVKHPRPAATRLAPQFPVKDPEIPFDHLRTRFAAELPGSRLRRRLCFRYTAIWTNAQVI
jgi:SAM-dependent methyltransferase